MEARKTGGAFQRRLSFRGSYRLRGFSPCTLAAAGREFIRFAYVLCLMPYVTFGAGGVYWAIFSLTRSRTGSRAAVTAAVMSISGSM